MNLPSPQNLIDNTIDSFQQKALDAKIAAQKKAAELKKQVSDAKEKADDLKKKAKLLKAALKGFKIPILPKVPKFKMRDIKLPAQYKKILSVKSIEKFKSLNNLKIPNKSEINSLLKVYTSEYSKSVKSMASIGAELSPIGQKIQNFTAAGTNVTIVSVYDKLFKGVGKSVKVNDDGEITYTPLKITLGSDTSVSVIDYNVGGTVTTGGGSIDTGGSGTGTGGETGGGSVTGTGGGGGTGTGGGGTVDISNCNNPIVIYSGIQQMCIYDISMKSNAYDSGKSTLDKIKIACPTHTITYYDVNKDKLGTSSYEIIGVNDGITYLKNIQLQPYWSAGTGKELLDNNHPQREYISGIETDSVFYFPDNQNYKIKMTNTSDWSIVFWILEFAPDSTRLYQTLDPHTTYEYYLDALSMIPGENGVKDIKINCNRVG